MSRHREEGCIDMGSLLGGIVFVPREKVSHIKTMLIYLDEGDN